MSESRVPSLSLSNAQEAATAKVASKIYTVGNLRYTSAGLITLFLWLLWGDFCFTLFESIIPRLLPIYLKEFQASNTLIGIMTGSIAGLINIIFAPLLSMSSDRYRSRWGRRIPFLLWSTPCTVVALILIGYAPEIGGWLNVLFGTRFAFVSKGTVVLSVFCILVVVYHYFNMVLNLLYYALFRDVVPLEVTGRFLSLFRVVGSLGGFVFSRYVLGYAITQRKFICVGLGIIYLVSFLLMCWRVREGEYTPLTEREKSMGLFTTYQTFFKECVSVPLYRNFILAYILIGWASLKEPFFVFFARDTLGISLDDIGKLLGWCTLLGVVLQPLAGYVCDRFGPLRALLISLPLCVATTAFTFFAHGWMSLLILSCLATIPMVIAGLAMLSVMMLLFPKEKYGQYFASTVSLTCASMILGNYAIGAFLDYVDDYRMIYAWSAGFIALGIVPMLRVYRGWKQHGGPSHYVAPLP